MDTIKIKGLDEEISDGVNKYIMNKFQNCLISDLIYFDVYETIDFPDAYLDNIDLVLIDYVLSKIIDIINNHDDIVVVRASSLNLAEQSEDYDEDPELMVCQKWYWDSLLFNKLTLVKW